MSDTDITLRNERVIVKRPSGAPWRIPDWAWALRSWMKQKRVGPRPGVAPMHVPTWYWPWYIWRNWADNHPKNPASHPTPPPPPKISPELAKARTLLNFCRAFDGFYLYGGGHGPPLSSLSVHQGLDCSSSTCLALKHVGLFISVSAWVSTSFEWYGEPGRGKYVTIHSNREHVWIEFTLPEGWFRFDTSPHGCGTYGPRVRNCQRYQSGFVARHPRGL